MMRPQRLLTAASMLAALANSDGSGDVGFPHLLIVLAAWGPCPG